MDRGRDGDGMWIGQGQDGDGTAANGTGTARGRDVDGMRIGRHWRRDVDRTWTGRGRTWVTQPGMMLVTVSV